MFWKLFDACCEYSIAAPPQCFGQDTGRRKLPAVSGTSSTLSSSLLWESPISRNGSRQMVFWAKHTPRMKKWSRLFPVAYSSPVGVNFLTITLSETNEVDTTLTSKTFQNYPKWFSYYACWFSSFRVTGCFPFTALHLACASAMSTRCQELAAETLLQSMRTGQLSCFTNQVPNNKRGLPHTTHFRVMPPPSQKQWLDFFAGLPQIQCV